MFSFSVTQRMVSGERGARVSSQPEGLRQTQLLILLPLFLELPKPLIPQWPWRESSAGRWWVSCRQRHTSSEAHGSG